MKTLITAIDKAQREGVYTLEEISVILRELDQLGRIVEMHEKQQKEIQEKIAQDKEANKTEKKAVTPKK
jgi:predicted patatin/cPLA2 family phospholipase